MCSDELAEALARDLDGHFERLVLAYQDRLYGFVLRLSGSPSDAEEIAQDAFVRAYRALVRYPADRVRTLALRPWLFQIALNAFRNARRGKRFATTSIDGADDESPIDLENDERERPEALAEQHEVRRDLAAILLTLPERYRIAVVLRHVEGLSYLELATLLGQPVGTVKANVHRGTKQLRAVLEKRAEAARKPIEFRKRDVTESVPVPSPVGRGRG